MLDRDAIFEAIALRMSDALEMRVTAPPIGYTVPLADEQPCGIVLPFEERPEQAMGLPPVHHIFPELRFYLRFEDAQGDPQMSMARLIGAVDAALVITDEERAAAGGVNLYATTLGGLVQSCWRENTAAEPGSLGRQAVVSMVLHLMAPEP